MAKITEARAIEVLDVVINMMNEVQSMYEKAKKILNTDDLDGLTDSLNEINNDNASPELKAKFNELDKAETAMLNDYR